MVQVIAEHDKLPSGFSCGGDNRYGLRPGEMLPTRTRYRGTEPALAVDLRVQYCSGRKCKDRVLLI